MIILNKLKNKNNILKIAIGVFGWILATVPAHAICPVCTVAVGAGLGLSRWLGISDSVTGVWAGALLFSVSMWTINWLRSKKISFKGMGPIVFAVYYGITLVPLYLTGVIGHPFNDIFGIDKLVFGILIGSFVFMVAVWGYETIKKKNGGKAWFPFQKVAMPVVFTAVASLIMYLIDK